MVEFTHRLSSGLILPLIIVLLVWAFRLFPKGHAVRKTSVAVLFFILVEAMFGAVLVKYGLVVDNDSTARAIVLSAHLLNTFLLLGALTLTAWWGGGNALPRWREQGALGWWFAIALLSTLVVGISGVIAALGDTLFPVESWSAALQQDLSPTTHILVRLRVLHPFLAIGVGFYLIFLASRAVRMRPDPGVRRLALATGALFGLQLACGFLNLALLAPIAMQLIHLFLADVVWVNIVLLAVAALAVQNAPAALRANMRTRDVSGPAQAMEAATDVEAATEVMA
jgi:cytochrome c oxidase assembly protein subunit 15